jgi:TRAP-type C4-dicarboxylate transport system substrate-binding protein
MGAASLSQEAWGASSPEAREAERIERAELFKRIENLDKLPQKAREAERAELVKKVENFRRSLSPEGREAERNEILKKMENVKGVQKFKQTIKGRTVYVVKMATLAPDGVGWASLIKDMINPGIFKETDGLIMLDWYYGATMGDDQDILAKMRNEQLQGGGFSGQGMAMACPDMQLLELPFLFENYNEVEYVYSKIRPRISQWFEKRGYHLLLLAEQDFDQIYSTKREMKTPEDFRNSRVLTWYGPLEEKVLKAMGSSPLPIRVPEVAASIRTGVCDTFISPGIWAVGTQMYTVMKYLNPVHIRYSPAGGCITLKTWNLLPKEFQFIIDNYVLSIEKDFRQKARASNEKCLKAMYKYGVKEVKMTTAEIDVMKKKLMPIWDELADKGAYSKADLAEVKRLLAEYRSKNKK